MEDEMDSVASKGPGENAKSSMCEVYQFSEQPPPPPMLREYLRIGLPCFGLWVAGPLLSLVDTLCIGLNSDSVDQVAALGPAITLFDGATYLFGFLNVATTNLYASARARAGDQSQETESVVRTAVKITFPLGLVAMIVLFGICRPFLTAYVGSQTTPAIVKMASDYVRIRCLTLPTVLVFRVLQASLVAAKKPIIPLMASLVSVVVNIAGNVLLVNIWKFGLVGAAIATTCSQFLSVILLLPSARTKLFKNGRMFRNLSTTSGSKITMVSFFKFALPVLVLIFGYLSVYGVMIHAAATLPDQPFTLASHQIAFSLFMFSNPFFQPISQTVQTFLPTYLPWRKAARKVSAQLMGAGLAVATVVGGVVGLIPAQFGSLITSDADVRNILRLLWPYLLTSSFLMAPIAVSEGVMLARHDLKFLAVTYITTSALLIPALLVKFPSRSLEYIWACLAVFQLLRAIVFTGRVWLCFESEDNHCSPEDKASEAPPLAEKQETV